MCAKFNYRVNRAITRWRDEIGKISLRYRRSSLVYNGRVIGYHERVTSEILECA